ncbi:MAG TPA: DUF2975 domain-containing protein [Candidatus Didemnitutus sp.]|nr:DUF2975 domain-containing protein [Candidatus Didemnitutus sp.]
MNTSSNPEIETKLLRIERMSGALRGVCTALLVIVGIGAVVAAAAAITGRLTAITFFGGSIPVGNVTQSGRGLIAGAVVLTGLVIGKALYHLRRLADNFSRREIFTSEAVRQIRNFGVTCMLWGVLKIAWAFVPAMTLNQPSAAVGVTMDSLVIGAVIIAISWFAEMATSLREENDLTI